VVMWGGGGRLGAGFWISLGGLFEIEQFQCKS
jgi:hypothetical protein